MAILKDLFGKSNDELIAIINRLAMSKATKLTLKVSKAGAVSIYGFGRWPVTLYRDQWTRIFEHRDEITAFIEANDDLLSTGKDDERFAKAE